MKLQKLHMHTTKKIGFLTYDNQKSIELKSKYVKDNNLHGIMFWQLMNDKKKMVCSDG